MINLGDAKNIAEIIEAIRTAEKHFNDYQVWCRGQAKVDWSLVPSAHRRHPILESQMANHFRQRAPSIFSGCPRHIDYVSWLPLMRHYGLPTRLLDWTESVSVAAFFATIYKRESGDSVIWVLSPGHLNQLSIGDFIPFISHDRVLSLAKAAFSPQKNDDNMTIAIIAPRNDPRMVAQLCNFTIHGSPAELEKHPCSKEFLAKIIIPESAHDTVASDLNLLGIRLSNLFPDLQHLSEELAQLKALEI